jgi:endonuclease/exonuclease/phosphatase family metal-dependent hydrolase
MKKFIKYTVLFIATLFLLFILFLVYSSLTEFRPEKKIVLKENISSELLTDTALFTVLSWNIGYAGLGAGMDFFYDGGTTTRDSRSNTINNLKEIGKFLKSNDTIDFMLLQEVDLSSKRSYYINEKEYFDSLLPEFIGDVGINYKVGFVPAPIFNPMGKVKSGIVTYTALPSWRVSRIAYPGSFPWPKRLFVLKRCFLENRFNLPGNKEFVLINTHNSAFDNGLLRSKESEALQAYVKQEFEKGNYVLIGGDWNQTPVGLITQFTQPVDTNMLVYLPKDFLKGWKIACVTEKPSNRNLQKAYNPKETLTSLIDFYIVSPNIEICDLKLIDLKFQNSDHQPILLSFRFIK